MTHSPVSSRPARPATRRAPPWLALLPALLPALLFLVLVLSPPLNQDVAAVLSFAERMVGGEQLYTDLIDVNPPLVFLLNLPPAWLASVTPLDGVQALQLCLLAFSGAVGWMCWRLAPPRGVAEAAMLLALLPLVLLLAGYDFGQREQIMAAAALPYLFLAERRVEGRGAGVAGAGLVLALPGQWQGGGATEPSRGLMAGAVLMAAVGFALKPHFLAVPALVEAVVLLGSARRHGWWAALRDPVPWLLAALWLGYVGLIATAFPAYAGSVLPLVWDYYIGLGGAPWWQVLLTEQLFTAAVMTLALAGATAWLGTRTLGWLPRLLAAAMVGALAAALVQHKGWSYHVVPIWMWGGLLCGVAAARGADALLTAPLARRLAPMLAAAATIGLTLLVMRGGEAPWREFTYDKGPAGRIATWLESRVPDGRLLVLSPDIYPAYPALNYAENRPVLRFMSTWLLQAVYRTCPADGARFRAPSQMGPAERYLFDGVAQDFTEHPPAAVLVARDAGIPWCANQPFDMIAYFTRQPRFAAMWRQYRQTGEIEGYMLFERIH